MVNGHGMHCHVCPPPPPRILVFVSWPAKISTLTCSRLQEESKTVSSQLAESAKRLEELSHLSEEAAQARQETELSHSGALKEEAATGTSAGTAPTTNSTEAEPPSSSNLEEVTGNMPTVHEDTVGPHTTGGAPDPKRQATGLTRGAVSSKRRRMSAAKEADGNCISTDTSTDEEVGTPHGRSA